MSVLTVNMAKLFCLLGLSFLTGENGGIGTTPSSVPGNALGRIKGDHVCECASHLRSAISV